MIEFVVKKEINVKLKLIIFLYKLDIISVVSS